jgi:hypothetical protein
MFTYRRIDRFFFNADVEHVENVKRDAMANDPYARHVRRMDMSALDTGMEGTSSERRKGRI